MDDKPNLIAVNIAEIKLSIDKLNDRMDLNEKNDEKERILVRQNVTNINLLADQLGGETGLITTTNSNNKNLNINTGILSVVTVALFLVAGWQYANSKDSNNDLIDIKSDIQYIKKVIGG